MIRGKVGWASGCSDRGLLALTMSVRLITHRQTYTLVGTAPGLVVDALFVRVAVGLRVLDCG